MNKTSRKKAVDDKCKDCNYDSLDKGTWRQQVESCECTDCPLFYFRPVSTHFKGHPSDKQEK